MSTMRQRRANATPDEKRKARALSALGGVPYLHALYTLRTLARLAGRIDIGDLAAVLGDRDKRRPIGLPVDSTDLHHLDRLFTLGFDIGDIGTVTSGATNETRLLLTVAIDDTTIHYEPLC